MQTHMCSCLTHLCQILEQNHSFKTHKHITNTSFILKPIDNYIDRLFLLFLFFSFAFQCTGKPNILYHIKQKYRITFVFILLVQRDKTTEQKLSMMISGSCLRVSRMCHNHDNMKVNMKHSSQLHGCIACCRYLVQLSSFIFN